MVTTAFPLQARGVYDFGPESSVAKEGDLKFCVVVGMELPCDPHDQESSVDGTDEDDEVDKSDCITYYCEYTIVVLFA